MSTASRPNIIYLVCHDLGRHLGCYGLPVRSPELDAFADEGVLFTNAFCNAPACSPSRACAMTGQYSHTNGCMGLVNRGWSLPEDRRTIVDEFNDAEYQTAHFGFQHERYHACANRYMVEGNDYPEDDWVNREEEWAERVMDRAEVYLAERASDGKPFYLNLGTNEVHASRWQGRFPDGSPQNRAEFYGVDEPEDTYVPIYVPDTPGTREMFGRFQGSIRHLDTQFKRLMTALDDTGLSDSTIVVFTTDHGIVNERAKMWLYDRGTEIALIMRVPGATATVGRYGGLIQNIDIAPTLLGMCGIDVPGYMQSRSFGALFYDGTYEPHREIFTERNYHGNYDPMRSVRTDRYHYIRNFADNPKRAWHLNDRVELTPWQDGEPLAMWPERSEPRETEELYDIVQDPQEIVNLAGRPEYADINTVLAEKVEHWMRETDDPLLNGPIADRLNPWPVPYNDGTMKGREEPWSKRT